MKEILIACNNLDELASRTLISGIHLMTPKEAAADNYWDGGLVRPTTDIRPATTAEVARIAAPIDHSEAIQILETADSLPELAQRADGSLPKAYGKARASHSQVVVGFPGEVNAIPADSLSTSLISETGEKVGLHFDVWPQPVSYVGVNVGPGERYMVFSPDVTLAVMPENIHRPETPEERQERRAFVWRYIAENAGAISCYFVRLDAPRVGADGKVYRQGYGNMPTDRVLHDGSTVGSSEGSSIALMTTPVLPPGFFRSVI